MKFILLSCIGASCLYTSLVFADIQVDAYTKNTSRTLAKQVQELLKTLPNQVRQQPQYIAKEKRIIALLHRIDVSKNGNRRW
jgi:hypothetical protein